MSAWEDIETAPKDGTVILVAHASNGAMFAAWWDEDEGGWIDGTTNAFDDFMTFDPTHWQPLPPPPEVRT